MRVNPNQWDTLNEEQKDQLKSILRGAGILKSDEEIVPDPNEPPVDLPRGNWLCEYACDIASAVCSAACFKLTNPFAIAACLKLCREAHKYCLKKC